MKTVLAIAAVIGLSFGLAACENDTGKTGSAASNPERDINSP